MMVVDNKFELKQIVYLKTDVEQKARIVTGFVVRETAIVYELSCGVEVCNNYDFEISDEKDVLIATTN